MKTIGVIIGTNDEPVSSEYYNKNKKMLSVLEEYDVFPDFIPYDYAIFAEIKKEGEKNNYEVIPLFGGDLTLKEANECDYILSIFEGVYSFMLGGITQYKKYMNILKKTKAKVFPSQKMQEFIIQKHRYMKYFHEKGYRIAPTHFINLNRYSMKTIMKFINKGEYSDIILKPELGAFKEGFKKIHKPTETKLSKELQRLKKKEYTNILLQPFMEEFNKFGEIKTYWINGKFIYAYKQQWADGEGVFQSQDKIDKQLLRECKITGSNLLKDIQKDHEKLIQCRIDFACCMDNDQRCREFFINEVEICPTIGEQESKGKAYRLLAKELILSCK